MMSRMEPDRLVSQLEAEGGLLAETAARAGLEAEVKPCAPWQVRDVLRHLGYVHRWAASYVAGPVSQEGPELTEAEQLAGGAPDDGLLAWFRQGHADLVATLRAADPDVAAWSFLPAPSPLAFWARRQAHETAIHRADVLSGLDQAADYPAEFAADGIDELIMAFCARNLARRPGDGPPGPTLSIRATDTGQEWLVGFDPEAEQIISVASGPAGQPDCPVVDCTVAGPASSLYLRLWNRPAAAPVSVSGDERLLAAWGPAMQVVW
jgi:uncharacterized protein (TIGR03083 family)